MQRIIFLVDMNAFFISCETMRNPALRGRPAAVAGDPKHRSGIILTANYEARRFGIKTTMTLGEARRLCPALVTVPPDHHYYSNVSRQVMAMLYSHTPVVEQNSIDEAWLDMTGCLRPGVTPAQAGQAIMDEIEKTYGLWCSVGISENKFLAKMACDMKKPMGLTELWRGDIPAKLWPLPVEAMFGVGRQTAAKLRAMGVRTVGELARCDHAALTARFGKYGAMITELANGVDNDPVTPHTANEMKSIGRSTTLSRDITDFEDAKKVIMTLAEEVGADARRHDKKGATVQITIKYADFKSVTRQKTVPATYLTSDIIRAGLELLQKNWNPTYPVRLLGISIAGFEKAEGGQLSLFDTLPREEGGAEEKLEKAVDGLRSRYGKGTIRRAALLNHKDETEP